MWAGGGGSPWQLEGGCHTPCVTVAAAGSGTLVGVQGLGTPLVEVVGSGLEVGQGLLQGEPGESTTAAGTCHSGSGHTEHDCPNTSGTMEFRNVST